MVADPPALRLEGVSFAYPDGTPVLSDVDLAVGHGERVAVLGPNGAGKTTLTLLLNGILTPDQGSVHVTGIHIAAKTVQQVRRRVGIVFQDPDDQLFMPSVEEDVAFGAANAGVTGAELAERVGWALDAVGMRAYADRAPHHLSFGQRRRVSIATVLVMRPDVLVLDEPTSNLDPAGRRELTEVLEPLAATIIVVSHDLPYALQFCARSVLLDRGVVVADRATGDLLADADLMRAHRLELPYGFDPAAMQPAVDGGPSSGPPAR